MSETNLINPEISANTSISELVAANFNSAAVFNKYGIDFCCGGRKPLVKAAEEKHIDLNQLISDLKISLQSKVETGQNYNQWNAQFLADYIINTHHAYVAEAIPRIKAYAHKVAMRHGENHPELSEVASLFDQLSDELLIHMMKEEKILFPYIRDMQQAFLNHSEVRVAGFGTVNNPIHMMHAEHDNAGNIMHAINKLTDNFELKPDACTTWKILFQELKQFEYDLHKHVHLENNILFPKAIELEQKVVAIKN